jgi:hypothetical protein
MVRNRTEKCVFRAVFGGNSLVFVSFTKLKYNLILGYRSRVLDPAQVKYKSDPDPSFEKNTPDLNPNMFFRETKTLEFQQVADRLMRLLGEEALCRLPTVVEGQVDTPCGICTGEKKKKHDNRKRRIKSPILGFTAAVNTTGDPLHSWKSFSMFIFYGKLYSSLQYLGIALKPKQGLTTF